MKRHISLSLSFLTSLCLLLLVWGGLAHIDQVAAQPFGTAIKAGKSAQVWHESRQLPETGDAVNRDTSQSSRVMMMATGIITANDDVYITDEDVTLNVVSASGVLTNDMNMGLGVLTAVSPTPPTFGTLDLHPDGSFIYTPALNANGIATFTYQAAILEDPTDMVAYWTLDDLPATTAYDYSGHGHIGTLVNGAAWVTDTAVTSFPNPYALYVDGVDDYVSIPDDAALDFGASDDFTVALWVKMGATQPDTANIDNSIVEKWTGGSGYPYVIRYLNQTAGVDNGKIQVVRYDGTNVPYMNSNATVNDNQFHHVAFVKNGGTLELYIDGVLDNNIPDTTTFDPSNSSPLFLGRRGSGTNRFQGTLDDLRIYDRGLSLTEVAQLAQGSNLDQISNTAVVTITVNAINDAPIAVADVYTATKYTTLNVDAPGVLANDSDVEGSPLSAVLLTSPLSGTLNFQPDGSFNYIPDIVSSGYQSFTYAAVEDEVVAYWPINDYTNPIPDMSGNGHAGTVINGLYLGTSSPVSAETLYLIGDNYVQAGGNEADFDLNTLSIGFWVKIDAFISTWEALVTKGDSSWRVQRYFNSDYISFVTNGLSNVDLISSQPLNDGQWHHVAMVYDGSTKYIYLDGVLDVSAPATGTISQNDAPVMIGENAEATGRYFLGMMDDIYIVNKALSASEVMDMKLGLGVEQLSSGPTTVNLNVLTPLVVQDLYPAANSHTATLTTSMAIGFNIPITPTSVTSQSLTVHGSMNGRTSGIITSTAAGITYDPAQDFFPGELVQSTLLTDVRDTSGDPLLRPYVWQFQTAAGVGPAQFADNGDNFGDRWTDAGALGDIDQDGDLDLVAIYNQFMFVWTNGGNGKFIFDNVYYLNDWYVTAVALGDLDGDSDLDIYVTLFGDSDEVWLNDGGLQGGTVGHFTHSGQLFPTDFSTDVSLGDVDGDSDLDAFVAVQGNSSRVLLNDGSGTFTDSGYNLGSHTITRAVLGDVDGDGDLDVFVSIYAATNQVWLNNGAGVFFDSGQSLGTGYSTGAALGDVDGDGDLDAFVTNIDSPNYSRVWLNNGSGSFTGGAQNLGTGQGVALGDVDGDGDLDAFVIDAGADRVLLNNGAGLFSDSGQSLGNVQSQAIALGDVDGDGDLDAFVGNIHYDTVWLNTLSASLSLQKSASSGTVIPGEMITYTLMYTNAGPHTAVNVIITDTIPASIDHNTLTVISSGAQITPQIGSTYVWQVADLAPGEGGTITITGIISSPLAAGPFNNQALISTATFETNTSNNSSTVTTQIAEVPPVAQDDVYTTTENVPLTVAALSGVLQNDYDLNGNVLTAVLATAPVTGSLQLQADGSFVYTPTLNYNGTVTFSYQLAAAENPTLMVGYWTMDDNATTAADSSGHGHTGYLVDGNFYVTDPLGHWITDTAVTTFPNPYALVLDGVDDYVFTSWDPVFDFGPDEDFSIAFWVKTGATQTDVGATENMILGKWGGGSHSYAVYYMNQTSGASDGRIQVSRSDGTNTPTIESNVAVNDNQFHHVAFVKNGSLLSLYIDGMVSGTTTDTMALPASTSYYYSLFLGERADNTRDFQGILDDLRIYERGLSAAEVARLADGDNADQFSQTAVVTLTVTPVNDAPIAADNNYTTDEDMTLNVAVPGVLGNDTDIDGDSLTAVLDSDVTTGTLGLSSDGSFTYTPPANWSGMTIFSYHANDGQANSNTAVVTLTVTAVNDVPVSVNDAYTTTEDTPLTVNAPGVLANDSDVEGNALTAVLDSDVTSGTLSLSSDGSFTYTPDANFCGTDSFTYHANDGQDDSSPATVTLTVSCVNDQPVANDDTDATDEDTAVNITVLDNDTDADGDTLMVTAVSVPNTGSTSTDGTTVTYTPENLSTGYTAVFTYAISDGSLTDTATVTVTVTGDNDAPTAADDMYSVTEDSSNNVLTVMTNDSDVDGDDIISLLAVGIPDQGGTAVISGTTILYAPAPDFVGAETFTYTIQDLGGLTDTATVTISVDNENDAPTAVDDSYSVNEDSSDNTFTVLDNDIDIDVGDSLSISSVSSPMSGTAVISGTTILYTPTPDFIGTETFTYTIQDLGGLMDTATVTVTVESVNHAPTAVDDNYTINENSSDNAFAVLDNDSDSDGDSLTISEVSDPGHGTAVISGTTILYTPAPNFAGTDTFTYTISDGAATSTAAVTVTVEDVADQTGFTIYLPFLSKP